MLTAGLIHAWTDVLTFVPRFIGFVVILIVGYLISLLVGRLVTKALTRVGFDGLVERGSLRAAMQTSGFTASSLVGKVLFYTAFLFTLQLAFGVFGPNPISALLTMIIAFLPNILVALAIVVIAASIASAVRTVTQAALGALSYGRVLADAAAIAILVIGGFAALDQLHIAPAIVNGLFYAFLAVVAGSAIVAIGGGGIVPMRQVWENGLSRLQQEAPRVREQMQANGPPLRVEQGGVPPTTGL